MISSAGSIKVGDQITINKNLTDQETVTVTAVTATTFTATFSKSHSSGFTITDGGFKTTANQAIALTTFQNIDIAGRPATPVVDLFSYANSIQTSSNTVQFTSYTGPLSISNASTLPAIPLPASDYVQISNAGPVFLGPASTSWSWSPSTNLNINLGKSTFTATSFLATYDARQQQLSVTGAGFLFLSPNKVATLAAAADANATTINVTGWNGALQLPYEIMIDKEEIQVDKAVASGGNFDLTVKRGQNGTMAASHTTGVAITGSTQVVLGNVNSTTFVVSPGIIVAGNQTLTQFYLTVQDSNAIALASNISITSVGLQFAYYQTTSGGATHNFFNLTGGANFTYTNTTAGKVAIAPIGAVYSDIETSDAEIPYTVDSGAVFPTSYPFLIVINREIMQVTGVDDTGTYPALQVTRGYYGTVPATHNASNT